MRLVDFKFSSADYDHTRPIYVAVDSEPQPVVSLLTDEVNHQLTVEIGDGRPLTLDAFVTRTQKLPGSWRIISTQPTTHELFGYRLIDDKIMFM